VHVCYNNEILIVYNLGFTFYTRSCALQSFAFGGSEMASNIFNLGRPLITKLFCKEGFSQCNSNILTGSWLIDAPEMG
jgi:hypothetical protein